VGGIPSWPARFIGAKRLFLAWNSEDLGSRHPSAGLSALSCKNRTIVINISARLRAISRLSGISRHQTTISIYISAAV
jgi:hypothetical protein